MRKLFTIIGLIITIAIFAQDRGDNTVIITNFPTERIDDLELHFVSNFYQIQNMDKDNIRFMTHPKPIDGSVYAHDLQVTIIGMLIGNDLLMYANYNFESSGNRYSGRADFHRRKNVGRRIAFDELVRVAEEFGLPLTFDNK